MGTLSGAVGEPSSVGHDLACVVESEIAMPVSPGEAFDLAHPIGVGIVVHHLLSFAARLGTLLGVGQGMDENRMALGRVRAVREAAISIAREIDGRRGIAVLDAAKPHHELGFIEQTGGR